MSVINDLGATSEAIQGFHLPEINHRTSESLYFPIISAYEYSRSGDSLDGPARAVARVQQNNAQNLLVEKLHIGAGSID